MTDIRVWDHQARTLRVVVWLHRLDMALSKEPAASGSLVWAQHSLGCLLAYFLAPGTAWGLQFKDVVDQVLWENRKQNERKHNESSSSLRKCCSRRTKLRDKFDAVSKTMEVIINGRSHREMEQRLAALQTSLNVVKTSITRFENLIEDCWMVEEELCQIQEDETHQEEEEEDETTDVEMVDEKEHGNPKSSGPHMEADTEDIPPLVSSWMKHPNLRIWQLDLTAPGVRLPWSQEVWPSYVSHPRATLGPRRMRPHNRSLPFSDIP